MNLSIDQQIDAAHSEAERIEQEARQIEARIVKAGGIPPTRPYGRPVSGEAVAQNLTLKSLLQRRDPALASYLGFGSDIARKREEEQQARILQAETLAMKTEALRRQNQQVAQQRYQQQLAGINPNTGRRW
jgi:hypothetical protein